jgi:hypothetical protein
MRLLLLVTAALVGVVLTRCYDRSIYARRLVHWAWTRH